MENIIENVKIKEYLDSLRDLDCGLCGMRSCAQFKENVLKDPSIINRCVCLNSRLVDKKDSAVRLSADSETWVDSLGREFDFVLDSLRSDNGPRETILLNNPARVEKLDIKPGDILTGRPMGMSCGCPVTHCGTVLSADADNGVVVWCITGHLDARKRVCKDIGYYSAQAYEGIVRRSRVELKIGMRYWFMPYNCMLQWRHSGLVNSLAVGNGFTRVRVEGLMIG